MPVNRKAVRTLAVVAAIAVGTGTGLMMAGAGSQDGQRVDQPQDAHTFPTNELGMTYGSAMDATSPDNEPDLIAAVGAGGTLGYVKKTDLDGPTPLSPEEAAQVDSSARSIPLYEKDGVTVIGEFWIGDGIPSTGPDDDSP